MQVRQAVTQNVRYNDLRGNITMPNKPPFKICVLEDCDRPITSGRALMCPMHNARQLRHGDPYKTIQPKRTGFCVVEGCEKEIKSGRSKYCGAHRYRLTRYGDVRQLHPSSGQGETREERFWSKVAKTNNPEECWEWQGAVHTNRKERYGVTSFEGRQWLTHRLAYFFANTLPPDPDLNVLHSCDNPSCCNPRHLREGTQADNVDDMMKRGRHYLVRRKIDGGR